MVGIALASLAGCSSEPDLGPVFNDEAGAPAGCLAHQEGEPGAAYVDVALRNTGRVLALMEYYTQFGTMPYCDGAAATDSDRAWAQTYLDLGGAADKIPTALA
jgi:hypothetical protein